MIYIIEIIPPTIDKIINCMLYTAFGYVLIMILWNVSTMIYFTMKYIIMTLCEVLFTMIYFTMKYIIMTLCDVLFTMITYARKEVEVTLNHLHNQLQQQDNEKLIAFLVVLVVIFIIMRLCNCLQQQKIKKLSQEKINLISSLQTSVRKEGRRHRQLLSRQREIKNLSQENAFLSKEVDVLSNHLRNQQPQEIKKLLQNNAKISVDLTCVICLDEKRNCCIDCEHVLMCITCSAHINNCPICRKPITNKIKIFMS